MSRDEADHVLRLIASISRAKKANLNLIFLFAFLIATSEKGASRKLRSAQGDDKRKEKRRLQENSCAADNKGRNFPT